MWFASVPTLARSTECSSPHLLMAVVTQALHEQWSSCFLDLMKYWSGADKQRDHCQTRALKCQGNGSLPLLLPDTTQNV